MARAGDLADLSRPRGQGFHGVVEYDGPLSRLERGSAPHHGGLSLGAEQGSIVARFGGTDTVDDEQVGEVAEEVVLDRGREDGGGADHEKELLQVGLRAFAVEGFDEGTAHGIAGDHEALDIFFFHEAPDFRRIELRDQDVLVPHQAPAHDRPLRGSVHEGGNREVDAGPRGLSPGHHVFRLFGFPPALGVDATSEGEKDVFVAPDHALGHARGPPGVEDVVVVRRARSEIAFRGARGQRFVVTLGVESRDFGAALVLDAYEMGRSGHAVADGRDPGRVLAVEDEGLQVGVVEDVPEFVFDVAVVDVDPHPAQLEDRPEGFDPLDAVESVDTDAVAGADAARREFVRQPVGVFLDLGVGAALAIGDQAFLVTEVVDGVLEKVGKVEFHGDLQCSRIGWLVQSHSMG